MNFKDIGIIIAKKPLKERSYIITIFTQQHGLYRGVIKESSSKRVSVNQEGNLVDFFWQARLHEHIGFARCELIKSYNGLLINNKTKLYAFNSITSLIDLAFHEREPHNNFFPALENYLQKLQDPFSFIDYIKLELDILAAAGYMLDLSECVLTRIKENLAFVSPKSGRAVSFSAGVPYADKLLSLPQFLTTTFTEITKGDQEQAFALTTYFFNRYIFRNNKQTAFRNSFMEHILSTSPA